jgi:heme oxygenase
MSLKEITRQLHHEAETTKFAKRLLSGSISEKEYATYLYQMLAVYDPIEFYSTRQGFFKNLPGIDRLRKIYEDFLELEQPGEFYQLLPSTIEYHTYLVKLGNDPENRHLIKAHLYVRHMGDLFGGQIIKGRVPGQGKFYQFDDPSNLKTAIRTELDDSLGEEACVAFQWAIKIMRELGGE